MPHPIVYNKAKTEELVVDLKPLTQQPISFKRAKKISRQLGCTFYGSRSEFLFWNPEFTDAESAELELFLPSRYLNFDKPEQHASFYYRTFPVFLDGEFAASVLDGAPAGNKENFGTLYQLKVRYRSGKEKIIRDPMATSMPFGIFAPAEIYDLNTTFSSRADTEYYKTLAVDLKKDHDFRIPPSVNLLEIHVQTATKQGTFHSLKERYKLIASKLESGLALSPDETNLTGFDAVELMPIDPVTQHPENHKFWDPIHAPGEDGDEITVRLRRPNIINWGYDVTLFGSAAINPSLLSTGRPDELLEFIETLHNFPSPIKVVLDVVYGHADSVSNQVLPDVYFADPSIYGHSINFRHPMVRATILEMQRRKINYGFDGIRVDGAQDFKYFDEGKQKLLPDDDFLIEMSHIKQNVAGIEYRPWMIFEDGRPWPRDDWKLAATYRDVTKYQPFAFQWAPMIFAYNTPYNFTYWVSKWWRIREMFLLGEKWISGYSNHDTIRRATQADPESSNVNTLLGNSLKMVMDNAYNNPSTTLLMQGFMPGIPMDFLQALGSTPWSFIRDTDTTFAIKVLSEEVHFLYWQVTENEYRQSRFFKRLKGMGFTTLQELRFFSTALYHIAKAADYNTHHIITMLNCGKSEFITDVWDNEKLNNLVTAWMHDLIEYCNVDNHAKYVNNKKASFNREIREYRLKNPWLINNFCDSDTLSYVEPVNGTVIYYGYRKDPDSGKEIAFVANMEGQPRQVIPAELLSQIKGKESWTVACSTPSITRKNIDEPVRLSISQGLLFEQNTH